MGDFASQPSSGTAYLLSGLRLPDCFSGPQWLLRTCYSTASWAAGALGGGAALLLLRQGNGGQGSLGASSGQAIYGRLSRYFAMQLWDSGWFPRLGQVS